MSARAASRLETLGFRRVYRYQPGKADWFAAGLPREGREAGTTRVADVAERDVPTCGISERVGAVRDRMRERGWDVCVVVDDERVVLGLVEGAVADASPATPVELVMRSNPVTFRPNIGAGQLPEYLTAQPTSVAIVTTSDGVLVGLVRFANLRASDRPVSRDDS
jgi:CBS domain-containing protein